MKRGIKILRALFRIYLLHITAFLAIWMGMYFPGLDIVLSVLYLILLWEEGKSSSRMLLNHKKQALVAMLWQLPGFILSVSVILGLDQLTDFAYYFIFILELWQTPILPLISIIPVWTILDKPLYYYLLFMMVPVMAVYYYLPARKLSENS